MKNWLIRTVCILFCLSLVFEAQAAQAQAEKTKDYQVGHTLTFGVYEQDNDETNGKEPIDWIILDKNGDKLLVISRLCLDAHAYHKDFVPMTWAECTLRTWLNETFLGEAFSTEEQKKITAITIHNPNNPHYSTKGGEDTTDKVFLLSLAEAEKYFPNRAGRRGLPTPYAVARGVYVNENGYTWWWLRTPGVRAIDACGVRTDGRISGYGSRDVYRPSGAIRPAMWVKLGSE